MREAFHSVLLQAATSIRIRAISCPPLGFRSSAPPSQNEVRPPPGASTPAKLRIVEPVAGKDLGAVHSGKLLDVAILYEGVSCKDAPDNSSCWDCWNN
jgi:hypothetical protein